MARTREVATQEKRVRRALARKGYRLQKNTKRTPGAVNYGLYKVIAGDNRVFKLWDIETGQEEVWNDLDRIEQWTESSSLFLGEDERKSA